MMVGLARAFRSTPSRVFLEGVSTIALVLLSATALVAMWWALTKHATGAVAESATRTAETAGPTVFLTVVALGWIDGIAGLLGFGPLRPGYLTFAGTIILIVALVIAYRNQSSPESI